MNRDDIIRMMQSACDTDKVDAWHNDFWTVTQEELERFHAIAVAAEREACAKICDGWASYGVPAVAAAAQAIRARGEK